jgi:hypothetical protein
LSSDSETECEYGQQCFSDLFLKIVHAFFFRISVRIGVFPRIESEKTDIVYFALAGVRKIPF